MLYDALPYLVQVKGMNWHHGFWAAKRQNVDYQPKMEVNGLLVYIMVE